MANKTSKFLLCENPMLTGDHDGRLFILHNREPKIFAEALHFENLDDAGRLEIEKGIEIGSRLNFPPETIFLAAQWVIPGDKFAKLSVQDQADELAAIMRRMADWYESYLIWEDSKS